MNDDYINIILEILGEAKPQRAQVLRTLSVGELIDEIAIEFEFEDSDQFAIFREQYGDQLSLTNTLEQQGIVANATLHFDRRTTQERNLITQRSHIELVLLGTIQRNFPILWQPAIIGRYDAAHGDRLAVDLEPLLGRRVSRKHAQIIEDKGTYYIESFSPRNSTRLNGSLLQESETYPLKDGDIIDIKNGEVRLRFVESK